MNSQPLPTLQHNQSERGEPAEERTERTVPDEPSVNDAERALSLDQIFDVLKNQRRRAAIQYLRSSTAPVTTSDLSEYIAALEQKTSPEQLSSKERKRVYVALYQCHLPKMDDVGVIDFDKPRGTITLGTNAPQLEPYLSNDDRATNDWSKYYLTLAGISGLSFLAYPFVGAWTGLPLVALLAVVVVSFLVLSLVHLRSDSVTDPY